MPIGIPGLSGLSGLTGLLSGSASSASPGAGTIENAAAKLVPFDLQSTGAGLGNSGSSSSQPNWVRPPIDVTSLAPPSGTRTDMNFSNPLPSPGLLSSVIGANPVTSAFGNRGGGASGPLAPIIATGGLLFPYTPIISEGVSVKYDAVDLVHSNESYYAYRGTDNVRITLSECVWTCDTFDNAIYAVAALHFFRTYSLMNFGTNGTGKPPSPMWFSAYGNYAFNRVPVLMERADWSWPNDVDYVRVPSPGTADFMNNILQFANSTGATPRDTNGKYTWMPIKFTISNISLIVQHSPKYWLSFSLDDYKSGKMINRQASTGGRGPQNLVSTVLNNTPDNQSATIRDGNTVTTFGPAFVR